MLILCCQQRLSKAKKIGEDYESEPVGMFTSPPTGLTCVLHHFTGPCEWLSINWSVLFFLNTLNRNFCVVNSLNWIIMSTKFEMVDTYILQGGVIFFFHSMAYEKVISNHDFRWGQITITVLLDWGQSNLCLAIEWKYDIYNLDPHSTKTNKMFSSFAPKLWNEKVASKRRQIGNQIASSRSQWWQISRHGASWVIPCIWIATL